MLKEKIFANIFLNFKDLKIEKYYIEQLFDNVKI